LPLDRDSVVTLDHAAKYMNDSRFDDVTHTKSTINDRDFGMATELGDIYSGHNILKIYFESYGVTVTKEVSITNYDDLTASQLATLEDVLNNNAFTFELYEEGGNAPVATASMNVDSKTLFGSATFMDSSTNQKFLPDKSKSYVIKEAALPTIPELKLVNKAADSEPLTGALVYAYKATNEYEFLQYADLTINKTIAQTTDENQSFIFNIKGTDEDTKHIDMNVVVNGNASAVVKQLPIGTYTVTEIVGWDWRYDTTSATAETDTDEIYSDIKSTLDFELTYIGESVTFTNSRIENLWLSGDSYCENWWESKTSIRKETEYRDPKNA